MTDIDTGDDLDRFADQLLNMIVTLPDGTKDTRRLEGFLDALEPDDALIAEQAFALRVSDPYTKDPVGWIRDKLGESLWSKQVEIAESVRDNRHTVVHACNAAGKSHLAARLAAWWIDTHAPGTAFVVTTAPTFSQVKTILWRYIGQIHRKGDLRGRVTQIEWWIGPEQVAYGRKPADQSISHFQGIHAKHVLVIIDEACGVPAALWDAAHTLAANDYSKVFAIGNPVDPAAYFAEICEPESDWNVIHVDGLQTPNFTGEIVSAEMSAELISPTYVAERAKDWGEKSPQYLAGIRGLFPTDAEDTVVPFSWLDRCRKVEHHNPSDTPHEFGFDVAASSGGDASVIAQRKGLRLEKIWETHQADAEALAEWALGIIEAEKPDRVKVDSNGVGHGIVGMLRTAQRVQGTHPCEIVDVNVSTSPRDKVRFHRLRDEMWWVIGREMSQAITCTDQAGDVNENGEPLPEGFDCSLAHGTWDLTYADPDYVDTLLRQLSAPKYTIDTAGRVKVEEKAETKKRIKRSPDHADAVLLAFVKGPDAAPVLSPGGAKQTSGWR